MPFELDLNDPHIRQYARDGYVLFQNVLDAELIAEAAAHVDWLQKRHPELRPENLGHTLMTNDAFWVRLVSDDRLLDIAQKFIGPNIALFASHYISKPPYDGQPVLWHQDGSYWPLEPMEVVTLWLAVDDSLPENGCMRVIPGTQHAALQEMKRRTDVASVLGSGMDESAVDETKAVDCVLKAGGVSVHHPNLIHGSNANRSPRRRCGLTIRYIPTTTRILLRGRNDVTAGRFPSAFLLRGETAPGVNDYNPRPAYAPETSMPFRGCDAWT
ncbi:MAG TPA: phytanoyl-CoA dioxygenase family protein [Chthonomonadaceae bacterium]|nr:phytanoyl-CoA dioxygenase family protein [Chthonomonadaceae bacterium]